MSQSLFVDVLHIVACLHLYTLLGAAHFTAHALLWLALWVLFLRSWGDFDILDTFLSALDTTK